MIAKPKRILWADDEIDLLRPHILFLNEKGYDIEAVSSGRDAIDAFKEELFDLVFLDEVMPGLSGLETLAALKEINPITPVVMITKSEDEGIMTDAIGKKIADYLIKPVNPHQILLSLKKNLHKDDILTEAAQEGYREEFSHISRHIACAQNIDDWTEIHRKLSFWDIELTASQNPLIEMLNMQKQEANHEFARFVKQNYQQWLENPSAGATLSPQVFQKAVFPLLTAGEKVFFILIDNFRLDQWMEVKEMLAGEFSFSEDVAVSILPTATQYARNAIFSGLMPLEIQKRYPHLWIDEDEDESKNQNEEPLIRAQLERCKIPCSFSYNKLLNSQQGEKLLSSLNTLLYFDLNVIVINFVDMLSHARTDSKMIRELAADEAAYRSLTRSWFRHSSTMEIFKRIADKGYKIVLTADHGTVRVKNPLKVLGDKQTNTNLRYKLGRNLNYDAKKVFEMRQPALYGLPSPNISTRYIFACGSDFFAYPNNYNHYVSYYSNTFQHGGVSLCEMIVPLITLSPK